MKALMIAIKPRWCSLIMNGDKTIEVRKNKTLANAIQKLIDEYGYAEIYVYCSKDKSLIYTDGTNGKGDYVDYKYYESYKGDKNDIGSGKVIFKFRCYKVEEITIVADDYFTNSSIWVEDLLKDSCLTYEELDNYLKRKNGYAIHISDLEIFDKPKELSEFSKCDKYPYTKYIGKAPQNFCYIEVE